MKRWMKYFPQPPIEPVIPPEWRKRRISRYVARFRARWLASCAKRLGIDCKRENLKVVEVGVHLGRHAEQLHKVFPNAHLYLVDPWKYQPEMEGYMFNRAHSDDHSGWELVFADVVKMFEGETKVHIMRMKSVEAAPHFKDGSLDIVYIDGNHTAKFVAEDVRTWLPKVKPGGILAGHDFKYSHRKHFTVPEGIRQTIGLRNIINGPDKSWLYFKD